MIGWEEGAERPHTSQRAHVYDDFADDSAGAPGFSWRFLSSVGPRTDAGVMTRRLSDNHTT